MEENNSSDRCCLCLTNKEDEELINPCECKGSMRYHEYCVMKTIIERKSIQCPQCKTYYTGAFIENMVAFAKGYTLMNRREQGVVDTSSLTPPSGLEVNISFPTPPSHISSLTPPSGLEDDTSVFAPLDKCLEFLEERLNNFGRYINQPISRRAERRMLFFIIIFLIFIVFIIARFGPSLD